LVAPNNDLEFDSPLGTTIAMWINSQDPNFHSGLTTLFYKGNADDFMAITFESNELRFEYTIGLSWNYLINSDDSSIK